MQSIPIDVFFSCSFDARDKDVNELFSSIARALGMKLVNVSTGSSLTPPDVAKKKISEAQAVLAVCVARNEYASGEFAMPDAVQDEISFAFGKDIPILMLVEEGVKIEGFKGNFGTRLRFNRSNLLSPDFIEKAVEAIHDLKLDVVEPHQMGASHGISDSFAEYMHHLIELKRDGDDFKWSYNTTKKLIYTKPSKRRFPASVWATLPGSLPETPPPIEWECEVKNSTRGIQVIPEIETQGAEKFEAILRLEPSPDEGDVLEYTTRASSRYLNPVWLEDVLAGTSVHLEDGDYKAADGIIFIHRTKRAVIEFRVAREYGASAIDFRPFVASYTSSVDYEVESELKRASVRKEDFGGNVSIRIEIESPLPGHIYGVAWNPRQK